MSFSYWIRLPLCAVGNCGNHFSENPGRSRPPGAVWRKIRSRGADGGDLDGGDREEISWWERRTVQDRLPFDKYINCPHSKAVRPPLPPLKSTLLLPFGSTLFSAELNSLIADLIPRFSSAASNPGEARAAESRGPSTAHEVEGGRLHSASGLHCGRLVDHRSL